MIPPATRKLNMFFWPFKSSQWSNLKIIKSCQNIDFALNGTSKAQSMIKRPTQNIVDTSFSDRLYKINVVFVFDNQQAIKTILKIIKIWT